MDYLEKVAYYEDAIMEKVAADKRKIKELNTVAKFRNDIPRPKGIVAKLREPENFSYNRKTRSRLSTEFDPEGRFYYNTLTDGSGRQNQQLIAESSIGDPARNMHKDDESLKEYDTRMSPKIKAYQTEYKKFFAPLAKRKTKKALLRTLTNDEVDAIIAAHTSKAKQHTKDAMSADSLKAINHYYT